MSVVLVMWVLIACSSWSAQAPITPTPSPTRPVVPLINPAPPGGNAGTAQPSFTPTPGPLTLTYWEEEDQDGDLLLDEFAEQFMADHPDILVTRAHLNYSELRLHFQAASAAGEAPPLIRAPGEFSGPFALLEIIKPVDELLPPAALDQFLQGALDAVSLRQRVWGVPDYYGNHLMLIYNTRFVDEVPANTNDWITQLKTLTDPDASRYGLVYNLNEPYWVIPWVGGFGGWPLDPQDRPTLDTRSMVTALQFVHDLKFRHGVTPATANYEMAYDYFVSEKAAYVIDGTWNMARYETSGVDFGVAALPKISASGLDPNPLTTGKYWFFSQGASEEHTAAALQFVAFVNSAESQQVWLDTLNRLPSRKDIVETARLGEDLRLAGTVDQLSKGRGIPPAPEMRCVWDAMRPHLAEIMAGNLRPAQAAEQMQQDADLCVAELLGTLPAPSDTETTTETTE